MKRAFALLALLTVGATPPGQTARFDWFSYRGWDPADSTVRPGPKDYRNPVLKGFYSDPSIVRVGTDYYLVTSTFGYFPGLPIFHSRDLVSWTQMGNAIDRPDQLDYGKLGLTRGLFAPAIAFHDGNFFIATTCVDCGGNFVITARNPAGPWSKPHWNTIDGIDPSLFFDTDGQAWITNNGPPPGPSRYDGHRAIWLQRFDTRTLQPVGERTVIVDGGARPAENPIWPEGPHLFRKGDWYYLITAEGGTAENHSEVAYRSRVVTGPYEPDPANPILTQRGLDPARSNPVTSAGHADFVMTPAGAWWSVFLAARPYTGDHYNTGRETFLLPVRWQNDWPQVTAPGAQIPYVHARPDLARAKSPAMPTTGAFEVRDEFNGPRLASYWMQIRSPASPWYGLSGGTLRLQLRAASLGGEGQPAYLGRRLQHRNFVAETALHFAPAKPGDRAGLAVVQDQAHYYSISLARVDGQPRLIVARRDGAAQPEDGVPIASVPYALPTVRLRIVQHGAACDFRYAPPKSSWRVLARDLDATILSTAHAGGYIGATVGPFARGG